MSTLMMDPVNLPSSRTTVDRTTIARLLEKKYSYFYSDRSTMCFMPGFAILALCIFLNHCSISAAVFLVAFCLLVFSRAEFCINNLISLWQTHSHFRSFLQIRVAEIPIILYLFQTSSQRSIRPIQPISPQHGPDQAQRRTPGADPGVGGAAEEKPQRGRGSCWRSQHFHIEYLYYLSCVFMQLGFIHVKLYFCQCWQKNAIVLLHILIWWTYLTLTLKP